MSSQWSNCKAAKTSWHWRESCTSRAGNSIAGVTNWIPRYPGWKHSPKAHLHAAQGGEPFEEGVGGKDSGGGFFQKCLAKSRGSTPAERQVWREGIYEHIREMMPLQGSWSVERMCELAPVGRAGFYRWLQEPQLVEQEMELRSAIQRIATEHRRRYGYRRIAAELRRRGMTVNPIPKFLQSTPDWAALVQSAWQQRINPL